MCEEKGERRKGMIVRDTITYKENDSGIPIKRSEIVGIIFLVGTVPNLPWWKLKDMTDDEIQKFNRSYLVEMEMSEDHSKFDIEKRLTSLYEIRIWNEALERAAIQCDKLMVCEAAARIRELKK